MKNRDNVPVLWHGLATEVDVRALQDELLEHRGREHVWILERPLHILEVVIILDLRVRRKSLPLLDRETADWIPSTLGDERVGALTIRRWVLAGTIRFRPLGSLDDARAALLAKFLDIFGPVSFVD